MGIWAQRHTWADKIKPALNRQKLTHSFYFSHNHDICVPYKYIVHNLIH